LSEMIFAQRRRVESEGAKRNQDTANSPYTLDFRLSVL
jgi:hypothetical protein